MNFFSKIGQAFKQIGVGIQRTKSKIDVRIRTVDIPKQEAITKDNISVLVNAVVYYKVEKPADAIIKIEDFSYAVGQYTQAALRDVVGNSELDVVLTEREKIADAIKIIVDKETAEWGVDISSIKIQEIEIPQSMKRAMARQAEAEREKRAEQNRREYERYKKEETILLDRKKTTDLRKRVENLRQQTRPAPMPSLFDGESMFGKQGFQFGDNSKNPLQSSYPLFSDKSGFSSRKKR